MRERMRDASAVSLPAPDKAHVKTGANGEFLADILGATLESDPRERLTRTLLPSRRQGPCQIGLIDRYLDDHPETDKLLDARCKRGAYTQGGFRGLFGGGGC